MQQYNQEELQASIAKLSRLGGDKTRMITDLFLSSSPLALHLQHGLAKRGSSIRRALTGNFEQAGNDMKARFTGLSNEAERVVGDTYGGVRNQLNAFNPQEGLSDVTVRNLSNPNVRILRHEHQFTPREVEFDNPLYDPNTVEEDDVTPAPAPETNTGVPEAATEAGGSSEATSVEDTATAAAKDVAKSTGSDLELAGEVADDTGIGSVVGLVLAGAGVISDLVGLFEKHKTPAIVNPGFQAGI